MASVPSFDSAPTLPTIRDISACLVHTPCRDVNDDRLEPPLGLLYVAALARGAGARVEVADLSAHDPEGLEAAIPPGFDVYGFSTYTVNYALTLQLAQAVRRRNPSALQVAGGPHASALPTDVARDPFDCVVTGEGELAFLDILRAAGDGRHLPRIMEGPAPEPLDDLPFPSYDMVVLSTYSRELDGHRSMSILSSRGCPYQCSFCNSNIMGAGRPMRYRSPANVIAEIRQIKETYGIRHFRFQDDIFTSSPKRVAELAPYLAAEEIVYRCFARINTCAQSPAVARDLKAGGCIHASFGVESGSPKLLSRHAMHKDQTPAQIRTALTNAHEAGLRTRIFLMVGFPGETDETIEETLALVKSCPWDEFSVYPLIAYPGTPLHDHPEQFGITHIDRSYSDYLQIGRNNRAGFTIRTAEFDEHKVRQWRDRVRDELLADGRIWAGASQGFK
ncbi:MAG: B12-binding domain-containing radical SAM protein [Acidobacteriia bacterium]|nr:B12-binding domain-containing radical SAM protein [Terriglobia bacterium]